MQRYCVNSLRYPRKFEIHNYRYILTSIFYQSHNYPLCVTELYSHVVMACSAASVPKQNLCKISDHRSSERLFCRSNNTALQLHTEITDYLVRSSTRRRSKFSDVTCSVRRIKNMKSFCPIMFQWR